MPRGDRRVQGDRLQIILWGFLETVLKSFKEISPQNLEWKDPLCWFNMWGFYIGGSDSDLAIVFP